MKKIILLCVCIVVLFLQSCTTRYEIKTSKMPLRQIYSTSQVNSSEEAWFFLVAASYNNDSSTEYVVKVFAKYDNLYYHYVEIPLDKLYIIIDTANVIPTLQVKAITETTGDLDYIHKNWGTDTDILSPDNFVWHYEEIQYFITCNERVIPEELNQILLSQL